MTKKSVIYGKIIFFKSWELLDILIFLIPYRWQMISIESAKTPRSFNSLLLREAKFQKFRIDMKIHWNFGIKVSQSFNKFHKISESFTKPYSGRMVVDMDIEFLELNLCLYNM